MKIKSSIFIAFLLFSFIALGASQIAQVSPLYNITYSEEKIYITGDLNVSMMGCEAKLSSAMNYTLALSKYNTFYNGIKTHYNNVKGINEAIKVASLSSWANAMSEILMGGISSQIYIDALYVEAATGESNTLSAEAKRRSEETSKNLQTAISDFETKTSTIATDLKSLSDELKGGLSTYTESNKVITTELQKQINEKAEIATSASKTLRDALAAKDAKDEALYKQLMQEYDNLKLEEAIADENIKTLKEQQTETSIIINGLTQSASLAVQTAAKLETVKQDAVFAKTMIEFQLASGDWKYASRWLGYKPSDDNALLNLTNNGNIFLSPRKFKTGSTEFYTASGGDTIFKMLDDMGIVVGVNNDEKSLWNTRYSVTPRNRFEFIPDANDESITNTQANFYPPWNWVDQTTIKTNEYGIYESTGIPMLTDADIQNAQHYGVPLPKYYINASEYNTGKTNYYANFEEPQNWFKVLTEEEKNRAMAKGKISPYFFELKYENEGGMARTNVYARFLSADHKGFSAPKNWADGTTIMCTDGVYRVAESYSNAVESLDGLAKHNGGGGRLFKKDSEISKTNPQSDPASPQNQNNPANPSFNWNDLNNEWNHIIPRTDSDVMAQYWSSDIGTLKSVCDLGKTVASGSQVGSNMTNVFSLHNFQFSRGKQIPFNMEVSDSSYKSKELCWAQTTNNFEIVQDWDVGQMSKNAYSMNLKGYSSASEGQVPYKKKIPNSSPAKYEIGWKYAGMNIKSDSVPTTHESHVGEVIANDASGKRLIFRSAQDSNVKIDVSTNLTGDVILTFGVYYK